ncbi:MAG: hypothetical protein ACTTKL_11090, partial [Treponema sp.]
MQSAGHLCPPASERAYARPSNPAQAYLPSAIFLPQNYRSTAFFYAQYISATDNTALKSRFPTGLLNDKPASSKHRSAVHIPPRSSSIQSRDKQAVPQKHHFPHEFANLQARVIETPLRRLHSEALASRIKPRPSTTSPENKAATNKPCPQSTVSPTSIPTGKPASSK